MTEPEGAEPEELRMLKHIANQRSVSLCVAQDLPSKERRSSSWEKLELYLKGLPLLKAEAKLSEEVVCATTKELLGLKNDQNTLAARLAFHERQLAAGLECMEQEFAAMWEAVKELNDDNSEVEGIKRCLDAVQQKVEKLGESSHDHGKLKYEEKVHKMMETIDLYATSLYHGRESIEREIHELLENINDDKLLGQIEKTQADIEFNTEERESNISSHTDSEWVSNRIAERKSKTSFLVTETNQRKMSGNDLNKEIASENDADVSDKYTEVASTLDTQTMLVEAMDRTIDNLADVDVGELLELFRYVVAVCLVFTALTITYFSFLK